MPTASRRVRRIAQSVVLTALFASCQVNCPFWDDESESDRPPRETAEPDEPRSGGCGGWSIDAPPPDAGANDNQRAPGNGDEGVALGLGDIAVPPDGGYFLARHDEGLIFVELISGNAHWVAGIEHPERLAFSPDGETVFVIERAAERLVAMDVVTNELRWWRPITRELTLTQEGAFDWLPYLQVSPDGAVVVVQGRTSIDVLASTDGAVLHELDTDDTIIDVDILEGGNAVSVVERHDWDAEGVPTTSLRVLNLSDGSVAALDVPNCASELVVAPDDATALMAPADCTQLADSAPYDPISLIDLSAGAFMRNLPGFGPVQITPDGGTAVGFLDMNDLDVELFDDPTDIPPEGSARYHLLLVALDTFELTTVELGAVLPRYAMTPDGTVLLVDSDFWGDGAQLRILDLMTLELVSVDEPDVRLDNFVITSDSAWVYLLWQGLWEVQIDGATAEWVPVHFDPTNINITPDDSRLLLRETASRLHVWQRDLRDITLSIDLVEALRGAAPPGEGTVIGQ